MACNSKWLAIERNGLKFGTGWILVVNIYASVDLVDFKVRLRSFSELSLKTDIK